MDQRLSDVLVELGFLDEDEVEFVRERQKATGLKFAEQIVEDNVLTEARLVSALSKHLRLGAVDPVVTPVHKRVLALIPPEIAFEHLVIPYARKREGDTDMLFVTISDPFDEAALDAVQTYLGEDLRAVWVLAGRSEIRQGLLHHYGREFAPPGFDDRPPPPPPGTADLDFVDADLVLSGLDAEAKRPEEAPLPRPLGPYTLQKRIGTGGMAEVYVATHQGAGDVDKTLVLKVLLPSLAKKPEFRKLFIGEAELSLLLRHPNLIDVYNLGEADGTSFIAMEHVTGVDLQALLERLRERETSMPLPLALYVVSELLNGLHYCHGATDDHDQPLNIVHRDVSPANILISYRGEVKLGDFGVAKATTTEQTALGVLKGKCGYMAPEQVLGEKVDRRTDVFAAAIVMHELLTGRTLFGGTDSNMSEVERLLEGDIGPPLSKQRPGISREIDAVVHQALARDAGARFQTAFEFRQAIRDIQNASELRASGRDLADFMRAVLDDEPAPPPAPPTPIANPMPRQLEGTAVTLGEVTLQDMAGAEGTPGRTVPAGQFVTVVHAVGEHVLVYVPPRGPAGYVRESDLGSIGD